MKQKPKYLEKKKKHGLVPLLTAVIVLLAALIGMVVYLMYVKPHSGVDTTENGTSQQETAEQNPQATVNGTQMTVPETTPSKENEAGETVAIESAYVTFRISEEKAESIRHMETVQGTVAVDVFYMKYADQEKELFRIYFGDGEQGDIIGLLQTDAGDITVSAAACVYGEEDFPDEDTLVLYHSLMEELNVILSTVRGDSRFKEYHKVEVTEPERTDTSLQYWNIALPEDMEWEEWVQNGVYSVDFYGTVAGERIKMYSVYMGEPEVDSPIGYYLVNGVQNPVRVVSYELAAKDNWSDEDTARAYTLLSSVNDVVQAIMSSEGFSTDAE